MKRKESNMKKTYTEPRLDLVNLGKDVIVTSGGGTPTCPNELDCSGD